MLLLWQLRVAQQLVRSWGTFKTAENWFTPSPRLSWPTSRRCNRYAARVADSRGGCTGLGTPQGALAYDPDRGRSYRLPQPPRSPAPEDRPTRRGPNESLWANHLALDRLTPDDITCVFDLFRCHRRGTDRDRRDCFVSPRGWVRATMTAPERCVARCTTCISWKTYSHNHAWITAVIVAGGDQ